MHSSLVNHANQAFLNMQTPLSIGIDASPETSSLIFTTSLFLDFFNIDLHLLLVCAPAKACSARLLTSSGHLALVTLPDHWPSLSPRAHWPQKSHLVLPYPLLSLPHTYAWLAPWWGLMVCLIPIFCRPKQAHGMKVFWKVQKSYWE